VDDAEDRGVGADAEGKEQDDEGAEAGMGAERAQGGLEKLHGWKRKGTDAGSF